MNTTNTKLHCYHCGEICPNNQVHEIDKYFCCFGCKSVYTILTNSGLGKDFYTLNKTPGISRKEIQRKNKYAFLEDETIASKIIQFKDDKRINCTFNIPQMHCSSCLWVLENLNKMLPGIIHTRVNFERKEMYCSYLYKQLKLRAIVELLDDLGYSPHIEINHSSEKSQTYNKKQLYKLGIAGFCFSNIMMLSFPEYLSTGDLSAQLTQIFRGLSLMLSLPVLFYCTTDMFRTAYLGLKNKIINIDLPVSIAVAITFLRSVYDIIFQGSSGYLDSMSGIVFFLLVGRWLQDKTYESINFERNHKSYFPIAVDRKDENGNITPILLERICVNDHLCIHHNEIIPADGILYDDKSQIDYSFVNGESTPVTVEKGNIIYAGGRQTEGKIEIVVTQKPAQSYLTNLWNTYTDAEKTTSKKTENVLSQYFTSIVLIIGMTAGIYWYIHDQNTLMWNAITTVLIVACPCALLLASNFTNGYIIRTLGKNNFYIKRADVLYKLQKITHIIFDKTGTLTHRTASKIHYEGEKIKQKHMQNIASLLYQSSHPISKSVLSYLKCDFHKSVKYFKETSGQGIEGWIDDIYYKLGSQYFIRNKKEKGKKTCLYVGINQKKIGNFVLENSYRKGVFKMLKKIKSKYSLALLTGDNESEKQFLTKKLGIGFPMLFNQNPDDKMRHVDALQKNKNNKVLMIGDGLNDMLTLRKSYVGIAVAEDNNAFTPSADVIMDAKKIVHTPEYIKFINKTKITINICFAISILYNIIGLYFAVQGILKPIIAAVLMMLSSISIISLSYGLVQYWTKKMKLTT